jgi:hypothetical protein
MSDMLIDKDDPIDGIDGNTLDGWIRCDSSRGCKLDNGKGLEKNENDEHSNSWIRYGDG